MKLCVCVLALVASAMTDPDVDLLGASNEQFTADMFQEVVKANKDKNVVLSAFSVLSPLAQLALASVGESHDEILKAIHLPNDNVTKEVFSDVTKRLRSVKGIELKQANRIYIRNGDVLNDQYAIVSRDVFDSDVKNIDFSKNVEAAKEINAWVEDNTNHRIKDLIQPSSLGPDTAGILVNAIYFKGKWKKPFPKDQTVDGDFHVSKDNTIKIPMMHKTEDVKYGESKELDAKLMEMSYEGDQSSLLVILPNQIDGITSLIEKLKDPLALKKAVENMYTTEVNVDMPKFKIETTTNLKDVLQKLHIQKLFTSQARLDNLIKGTSDLYINSATQKAFIEVNEEGAEAGAANEFGIAYLSAIISETREFKADHPFVFFLMEENNIMFNGVLQS